MSYDLYLINPHTGDVVQFEEPLDIRGGTYAVGGTEEAWLNITYNYSRHFRRLLGKDGIKSIYGMTGAKSIPLLENAIEQLGDDVVDDYWAPTEGNAKKALKNLLSLAELVPNGVWQGD